jgi:hypothetical protein
LGQSPINSDTFNLTADLATLVDSMEVIVPVASDAAGDTIATARAAAGFPVTDARPLFVYNTVTKTARVKDSGGWRNLADGLTKTFAHVGRTGSFQTATGGVTVVYPTPQYMFGGITWDSASNQLVVPVAGYYRVNAQYYFTGATGAVGTGYLYKNTANTQPIGSRVALWKADSADYIGSASGIILLAAGDKVGTWINYSSSTWGTDGWNGTFMEVELLAVSGQS